MLIECPVCEGDGAVYVTARGRVESGPLYSRRGWGDRSKHPIVCPRCDGDGDCEAEITTEVIRGGDGTPLWTVVRAE